MVFCPIVLHYHIKSWHGIKQLNVLKECSSIRSNPCQLCFPEPLPWILGEVRSVKASRFHVYLVSCYLTQPKTLVCHIKEQPWFPEVFLLDHQCLLAATGMAYPQFSLSRDLKCVKELQCLHPRPVPIVPWLGEDLHGLQKLYPHQHRDLNPYKEDGKKHPWGFFLQTSFSHKHFSSTLIAQEFQWHLYFPVKCVGRNSLCNFPAWVA